MAQVGGASSILVILRGNSGSGKTTTAREVRFRCGRGIAIVSQDAIRRDLLREKDLPGGVNIGLIDVIASHALDAGYHVNLEGVFHSAHYGGMLGRLRKKHRGRTACFYFDLPFAETLRRHASKPQAAEYGEREMRSWYRPLDLVPALEEHRIDGSLSLGGAIELVIAGSWLARLAQPHDLWNQKQSGSGH